MKSAAPENGAQINDPQFESLICEESGNDILRFPWSLKSHQDFRRPYQLMTMNIVINTPRVGRRVSDRKASQ